MILLLLASSREDALDTPFEGSGSTDWQTEIHSHAFSLAWHIRWPIILHKDSGCIHWFWHDRFLFHILPDVLPSKNAVLIGVSCDPHAGLTVCESVFHHSLSQ